MASTSRTSASGWSSRKRRASVDFPTAGGPLRRMSRAMHAILARDAPSVSAEECAVRSCLVYRHADRAVVLHCCCEQLARSLAVGWSTTIEEHLAEPVLGVWPVQEVAERLVLAERSLEVPLGVVPTLGRG